MSERHGGLAVVIGGCSLALAACGNGPAPRPSSTGISGELWSVTWRVQGLSANPIDNLDEAVTRAEAVIVGRPTGIHPGRSYQLGPGAGAPSWSEEALRSVVVEIRSDAGVSYSVEMVIEPGTAVDGITLPDVRTASFIFKAYVDSDGRQVWACLEPGWCGITSGQNGALVSLTSNDVTETLRGASARLPDLAKAPAGS